VGEEAAEASSASLPTMPTRAVVVFVLAVFCAAKATAVVLVMGMSVVH
jgi:hypothetical protein